MKSANIIKNPRITEKTSYGIEQNVYTFDVSQSSNKTEIGKAVFALYKVKPVKINVLPVPRKTILSRGKVGVKSGGKKALVFLKKGDKIEFV